MGGWWQLGEVMVAGGLSSELAEDIEHLARLSYSGDGLPTLDPQVLKL